MPTDYVSELARHVLRQIEAGDELRRAIVPQYLPAIPRASEELARELDSQPLLKLHLGLILVVDVSELAREAARRIQAGLDEELKIAILQHLPEIPDSQVILVQEFISSPGLQTRIARLIWYTSSFLAGQAFKRIRAQDEILRILGRIPQIPFTSHGLAQELEVQPELQAELAWATGYTPSRWLLDQELGQIDRRRRRQEIDRVIFAGDSYQRAANSGLMGLCFSGGGIRSATFNLGILQGLARLRLLHCFDYLSSVSGGGYIHQWLAAWSKRTSFRHVAEQLIPLPEKDNPGVHPLPIRWLRRYSNYLTPQRGILSADTWVAVGTWLRNTILNQIILITGLFCLVLLPHLLLFDFSVPDPNLAAVTIGFLFLMATFLLGVNLSLFDKTSEERRLFGQRRVQALLVLPLLLAALLTVLLFPVLAFKFSLSSTPSRAVALLLLVLALTISFFGRALGSYITHHRPISPAAAANHTSVSDGLKQAAVVVGLVVASGIATVCGTALIVSVGLLFSRAWPLYSQTSWRLALVLGPPLVLAGAFVTILLLIGLLGRTFLDARREWLARFAAWTGLYALAWILFVGISLFGHAIVTWLTATISAGIPALLGWIGTSSGAVIAGKSSKTAGAKSDKTPSSFSPLEIVAVVGPYVFIAGLLLLLAWAAEGLLAESRAAGPEQVVATFAVPALVCLLLAWRVDINEFSMHAFYRNRLVRCYLGASNPDRKPNPFTGFDKNDAQVALRDLLPGNGYDGPFPILSTALNLTFGQDLAWQERKAASFAFTPLCSGYDVPWTAATGPSKRLRFNGFVETEHYAYPPAGVHISTAAAISGAALSPNWGYHSNPATAFLMTVFNVRLGWWLRNPRVLNQDGTRRNAGAQDSGMEYPPASPRVALLRLIGELLGRSDDISQYVYLTDGGHFDNMGLYELVRRRCRYIVVCDAEDDGALKFEGIGMAIRKSRIDFGVEISLDLRPLQHIGQSQYSMTHCVVGKITYPEDPSHPGVVVYLKSSLTGDEPGDVLNYKKEHPPFPHDATLNQWFTESQFESYRRLGNHIAFSIFEPARPEFNHCARLVERERYFRNLEAIWCAPTPEMAQHSAEHSKRYGSLLRRIRTDQTLPGFFDLLFRRGHGPLEWKQGLHPSVARTATERAVAASSELIEFIFIVFLQLNLVLPENSRHPFAQGWFRIFRTWVRIDVVQDAWRRYGPTYSRSFQIFAHRELGLPDMQDRE